LVAAAVYAVNYYNLIPKKHYTAADFRIETISSSVDRNQNGIGDTMDIVLGARKDAVNKPKYDGSYYAGGYPPDNIGVCTDVVWRAFKNAGYSLKAMVDKDIGENVALYPDVKGKPDPNIDFRRVTNLMVYFGRKAESLTLDPSKTDQWQPGDFVTYGSFHIGIVSDIRNNNGVPYIIHNAGQPMREEDALTRWKISGHYRFDAAQLEESDLIPILPST
jgi:uncharacterized protein YijF (DUF1287 family)